MRITANQLTILRVALLPFPYLLLYGDKTSQIIALIAFSALGLTDYLDGLMARKYGATRLGELLDPIADKIFMAVALLPMVDLGILPLWIVFPIFLREFIVTELRKTLSGIDLELKVTEIAKIKTTIQMTGAGLILLTHIFPDKTVTAAFLAGAILATVILAMGLYWVDVPISKRMKWAIFLLSMALLTLLIFKTSKVILIYGVIIAFITVTSSWNYLIKGLPACVKQGSLPFSRTILSILFPSAALVLLGMDKGITPYLIMILALEFASQGIDMWAKKERARDISWVKPMVIFPAAIIIFLITLMGKNLIFAVNTYILFIFYLSILYAFFELWLHRKFLKDIWNTV